MKLGSPHTQMPKRQLVNGYAAMAASCYVPCFFLRLRKKALV